MIQACVDSDMSSDEEDEMMTCAMVALTDLVQPGNRRFKRLGQ